METIIASTQYNLMGFEHESITTLTSQIRFRSSQCLFQLTVKASEILSASHACLVLVLIAEFLASLLVDAPASVSVTLLWCVGAIALARGELSRSNLRCRDRLEGIRAVHHAGALLEILPWLRQRFACDAECDDTTVISQSALLLVIVS